MPQGVPFSDLVAWFHERVEAGRRSRKAWSSTARGKARLAAAKRRSRRRLGQVKLKTPRQAKAEYQRRYRARLKAEKALARAVSRSGRMVKDLEKKRQAAKLRRQMREDRRRGVT